MQPAQNLRALFLGRPAEIHECALGCRDGAPRILYVGQRDAAYQLARRRTDDVHGLAAVGFDERSIDVVLRDCLHRAPHSYNDLSCSDPCFAIAFWVGGRLDCRLFG